jgi:YD repeat-containing protein
MSSPPEMITTFEYDPNGNLIRETQAGKTPRTIEYSYDARNNHGVYNSLDKFKNP